MIVLTFIKLFLALADSLSKYARDKQLMDAGAAEAVLKGVNDANEAISRANRARNGELPDTSDDENNRDNQV